MMTIAAIGEDFASLPAMIHNLLGQIQNKVLPDLLWARTIFSRRRGKAALR